MAKVALKTRRGKRPAPSQKRGDSDDRVVDSRAELAAFREERLRRHRDERTENSRRDADAIERIRASAKPYRSAARTAVAEKLPSLDAAKAALETFDRLTSAVSAYVRMSVAGDWAWFDSADDETKERRLSLGRYLHFVHLSIEAAEVARRHVDMLDTTDMKAQRLKQAIEILDSAKAISEWTELPGVHGDQMRAAFGLTDPAARLRRGAEHAVWMARSDTNGLARIPQAYWSEAIRGWEGEVPGRGGNPRRGSSTYSWARVVYDLLKPFKLTDATSSASLARTLKQADLRRG